MDSSFVTTSIKKEHLDKKLIQQIDDMQKTIDKMKRMVEQLYYPYKQLELTSRK